jgi:hypothetical protein
MTGGSIAGKTRERLQAQRGVYERKIKLPVKDLGGDGLARADDRPF